MKNKDQNISSPLATFELPWLVRFADTDASGFAHFSSYLRMMEETEYAFLRSRSLSVVLHDERGTLGFPRLSARLAINSGLQFDQAVKIRLSLMEIDGKQLVYEFDIVDGVGRSAVNGKFVNACCRFPDGKPPFAVLIPEYVEQALRG